MADMNQQQVIEYIKGISVLELSQLVKALESELGVSAAAGMPMAMPGGAGGGAAAAAPVEEKTDFNVTLVSFPADKKINIIKVVREVTSLGLRKPKTSLKRCPRPSKKACRRKRQKRSGRNSTKSARKSKSSNSLRRLTFGSGLWASGLEFSACHFFCVLVLGLCSALTGREPKAWSREPIDVQPS